MPTINLNPTLDPEALSKAIVRASRDNQQIVLMHGTHLTKPGRQLKVKIGPNGLNLSGSDVKYAILKRPDYAIEVGSPDDSDYGQHADDNYGLFFIPDDATEAEFNAVPPNAWKTYTDSNNRTFEYFVLIRGVVKISNLTIDCNMGRQKLQGYYANMPENGKRPEHSCMIGFSGTHTNGRDSFSGKRIYIGFSEVILDNIRFKNGGYADDLWISRGYFNPNIEHIKITNIKSTNRVDPHRGTICFSGLTQKVTIENADIFRLECEETSTGLGQWHNLPRKAAVYAKSQWQLKNIKADYIDLAVKGKALDLTATKLQSKISFNVYQIGGNIKNSTFRKGKQPRLIRLDHLVFTNVNWLLQFNESEGKILGLKPSSDEDDPCIVHFIDNEFKVEGTLDATTVGALVTSEYARNEPLQRVEVTLKNCRYDPRFGSAEYPDTNIIWARQRGTWILKRSDFGTIPLDRAVSASDKDDVVIVYD